MVWGAKFQRNILLVSAEGCLKMGVVCLLGTVSIPDDWVSVRKYTFLVLFGLKLYEAEWVLVWNTSSGSTILPTNGPVSYY